jgi:WD40 repeat protein
LALEDQPASTDSLDDTFEGYRLLEKLGEGGMGVVWLAQQEHPIRRLVALKAVKPGGDLKQVLARFESERQALAILGHPNIATVFDAGVTRDGRPYFAMEYVPGLPITTFADQHGLTVRARLELFLQVCEGVEHAHQKGVLHRDLKPNNILVANQDGRALVKIIDFGVAKAIGPRLSAETNETVIGVLLGTPEYMSPEQAGLTQSVVDTRTDIYSLGLVLYELLVGALPFDARELRDKAVMEMLRAIREDEPPRLTLRLSSQSRDQVQEIARRRLTEPRTLVRQLRGDLEWITNRALEKEPARRYPSASELRADVRRHLSHDAVLAGPPALTYRLGKIARRHRAIAAATVAVVAIVVAATVLMTLLWVQSERARANAQRLLVASLVASGTARMESWDWAGGLLSFVKSLELEADAESTLEHRVRIGQILRRMPRLTRLWPHGLRVKAVDVSAHGIVASAGTDGTVRLWSLQEGHPIATLRHGGAVHHVVFSADGDLLASASEDMTARVWRAADGRAAGTPLLHGGPVHDVAFSPDSKIIATAGADGIARLWRIGEETPYAEIRMGTPLLRVVFTRDGTRIAVAASGGDSEPFAVRLWSTTNGAAAGAWIRGQRQWSLVDMDVSPDGAHIVTAGNHSCYCALLWSAATGRREGNALLHRNTVATARFDASGTQVVTGGYDRIVQIWAVPSGETVGQPWALSGWPEAVRFAADGQLVASTANGAVEIVAPGSGPARENARLVPTLTHAGAVTSTVLDSSGRFIVTGSADGAVRVWDLAPARLSEAPFAWYASEWVTDLSFLNQGRYLASAERIYDTISGRPLAPPMRAGEYGLFTAVSHDGRRVATAGQREVRVWDVASGEPVSPILALSSVTGPERSVELSADGRQLLTLSNAGATGEATLWDVATGRRVHTLRHAAPVTAGAFLANDTMLMTASAETHVNLRIWRVEDKAVAFSARHPEGIATAVVDNRNNRILTAGFDQRVLEWRIGSSLTSRAVIELQSEPMTLAIGSDGTVVAGGRGGDVHALTTNAGGESVTSMSQTGAVVSADVSADRSWLVASGDDGRTNLWNFRSGERLSPAYRILFPSYAVKFVPDSRAFAFSGDGVYVEPIVEDDRPIQTLTDLAEVVSARRIAAGGQTPLRLEELVARWSRLASAGQAEIGNAPPNWLRRQAALALRRGNAAIALDHLDRLRMNGPPTWTDIMVALAAMARAGHWSQAIGEVQRLGDVHDSAPELTFVHTVARRRAGEQTVPRAVCDDLVGRYGTTMNPDRALWVLRTCLLDPDPPPSTLTSLAGLLNQVVDLRMYGTRESLSGALAVRAGRFSEAIDRLRLAIAGGENTPHTQLFLAMAFARSGNGGSARKSLRESGTFAWPATNMFAQKAFRDAWFDAEAIILREEVERILAKQASP